MKSKKFLFAFAIVGLLFIGTSFGDFDVPVRAGFATTTYTTTYSNSDVDTLTFQREATLAGLSFSVYVGDSADFQNIVLRRQINGVLAPYVTGDSLIAYTGDSLTAAGARLYTVTLAPIAEAYVVFVKYDGDGGGVQAGNSPTVRYAFNKQYNR